MIQIILLISMCFLYRAKQIYFLVNIYLIFCYWLNTVLHHVDMKLKGSKTFPLKCLPVLSERFWKVIIL